MTPEMNSLVEHERALRLALGMFCVLTPIYFFPTLVACLCRHKHLAALFALNLLLGWTFLFWAIAMVWALMRTENQHGQ